MLYLNAQKICSFPSADGQLIEFQLINGLHILNNHLFSHFVTELIMKARFSTKCSVCDAFIEKGKEIVKNEAENWVHKHCANEILEIP